MYFRKVMWKIFQWNPIPPIMGMMMIPMTYLFWADPSHESSIEGGTASMPSALGEFYGSWWIYRAPVHIGEWLILTSEFCCWNILLIRLTKDQNDQNPCGILWVYSVAHPRNGVPRTEKTGGPCPRLKHHRNTMSNYSLAHINQLC